MIALAKAMRTVTTHERTDEVVSLVCRRRDCEYKVVAVMPEAEERAVLEERLAALLWSGGES